MLTKYYLRIQGLLLLVMVISSCGNKVEYFRHIQPDGKFSFIGNYPVAEAESKKVNCYRITSSGNKISTIEFLNRGRLSFSEHGFARLRYQYHENVVLVSYENEFSLPVLIEESYRYERYRVNSNGTYHQMDYLDRNYHPVVIDDVRVIDLQSDPDGRITEFHYYGLDGRTKKDGVYGIRRSFDNKGRLVEVTYIDQESNTMADESGVASVRYGYDDFGNELSISYFDINNKAYEAVDGMATTRWKHDRYGNKVETVYYDRFDNIVNATQDVAINTYSHDNAGNIISRAFYDSLRNPAPFNGFVKVNFFYDREGYCTKQFFFKEHNDSIYQDHYVRLIYDNVGNLREQKLYDPAMKPLERDGIAAYLFGYDGAHNMISYQTYDAEGYLVPFESGIAQVRWTYNTMGEKTETRYFDTDGRLKGGTQHEAVNKFVYDECGLLTERSYYDSLERPINYDGAAIVRYRYDEAGRLVDEVRLDQNGAVVEEPLVTTKL